MPNRVTGLNSGLDTESLVTSLVSGYQKKVDTLKNDQTKYSWKMDTWKGLNSKVNSFYNGKLSSMTLSSAFKKKTTIASNPSAVTVTTGDSAMDSTQKVKVTSLASSAYMTGDKAKGKDGADVKRDTKLSDLDGMAGKSSFSITVESGGKTKELTFNADQTVADVQNELKKLELNGNKYNANFDDNQGRFYVAATTTGESGNFTLSGDTDFISALGLDTKNVIKGSDAKISLNGVDYTSKTGTFEINGLTITANQVTDDEFTLTTKQDTSGIYDMVKGLFKEYNDLIKEMDTLYTDSTGLKKDVLTDEQKDAMSDKEVEEWTKAVKGSLLYRDSTLSTVIEGLKTTMSAGIDVKQADGTTKRMYLSDFGINTGEYTKTDSKERGMYHIDGDKDDSSVSSKTDTLSAMIASDPDTVASFFSGLAQSLHGKLFDLMKGTDFSSNFTIYEDKLMASQYSAYNTKISTATDALNAKEDYYYSKFSKMETALSSINSTSNAIGGYFG